MADPEEQSHALAPDSGARYSPNAIRILRTVQLNSLALS
jgi:hypothetical protein